MHRLCNTKAMYPLQLGGMVNILAEQFSSILFLCLSDLPRALHCTPWMLVNQAKGLHLTSSLNAMQLLGFDASEIMPEAGAQKALLQSVCRDEKHSSLFTLHCFHPFTSK